MVPVVTEKANPEVVGMPLAGATVHPGGAVPAQVRATELAYPFIATREPLNVADCPGKMLNGLLLTLIGAACGTYGVWLSPDEAIERGVSRWSGGTRDEQLKLPPVQNLLEQSHFAVAGFFLIAVGTAFQIGGLLLPGASRLTNP